ncbi:MAG: hypothetical protein C7B46_16760 [Sulfobacillus benefaciens]|uniref:Beta-lactamase class A catalytic domain-containing protein n=1 Tax=Sulfobacillus benefaciens TaxID=453960 RepID=A0A2T2XAU8_9FIRM|nr:MAG: hypothetical protein C7B46_16760 [Sulfobacillus benefaciens]
MNFATWLDAAPGRYGVFALNLVNGKSVSYHEKDVFPSASTIKVPIMIEVFRRVEEDHLSLDSLLTLRAEDQVGGSGILFDLTPGSAYSLRDLTTLMITVSDNTATNLLIDYLGVDAVNATMRRLGAHDTVLERRLQRVPVERPTVNRTTPYDLALMMERLAKGECVSLAVSERMVSLLKQCQGPISITALEARSYFCGQPPTVTVAHKTGSLSNANHDAGIVYSHDGLAYVAAIMSEGAPHDTLAPVLRRIGRALPQLLR